jgi:hypothetical protein
MFNILTQLRIQPAPNPYFDLSLFKTMLHQLEISYRIHGDDGTLSLLNTVQRLHDKELQRVRLWHTQQSKVYEIRNDIDFEYILRRILV